MVTPSASAKVGMNAKIVPAPRPKNTVTNIGVCHTSSIAARTCPGASVVGMLTSRRASRIGHTSA